MYYNNSFLLQKIASLEEQTQDLLEALAFLRAENYILMDKIQKSAGLDSAISDLTLGGIGRGLASMKNIGLGAAGIGGALLLGKHLAEKGEENREKAMRAQLAKNKERNMINQMYM